LGCAVASWACSPATATERIRRHVESREARYAGKLAFSQDDVPKLPLRGLELWRVTVAIPDVFPLRCYAAGNDAFCEGDDGTPRGALERLARKYDLGAHPEALSDSDWIALVRFDTVSVIVNDPAGARELMREMPQPVADRVKPPKLGRVAGGGVEV